MYPELTDRFQTVVYWEKSSVDDYGEPTISSGVELSVRWERETNEVLSPTGETINTDITLTVDQELVVGSLVWYGIEEDLPDDVTTTTNLYQVVAYEEIPDVKNRVASKVAYLKRFNDTLPTIS